MMSFRSLIVIPALAAVLALVSFSSNAAEQTGEAGLVVYRAGELARTERLRVDVRLNAQHLGSQSLGRLKSESVVSTTQPAGTYKISTGISGSEPLEVDLKPGHVHYVRIDLKARTQHLKVSLVEVEETVAHVERPESASAI